MYGKGNFSLKCPFFQPTTEMKRKRSNNKKDANVPVPWWYTGKITILLDEIDPEEDDEIQRCCPIVKYEDEYADGYLQVRQGFDVLGTVLIDKQFTDGVLDRVSKKRVGTHWNLEYFDNGEFKLGYSYSMAGKVRHVSRCDEKGRVVMREWRENGDLNSVNTMDKHDNDQGYFYESWGGGIHEGTHRDNERHGLYRKWDLDGTLIEKKRYSDGHCIKTFENPPNEPVPCPMRFRANAPPELRRCKNGWELPEFARLVSQK